jgi:hypothetical protein
MAVVPTNVTVGATVPTLTLKAGVSGGLAVANSIDASNDYLSIYTASATATQGINRNTLLNLSSQPVGITDSQVLSNKTINNTNSTTLKDGSFTLQNSSGTTKQANFSLSGITAGNTRTITLPDYNATMASLAGTETLTNKTLTSPTINSPTISNATITADTVSGYTSTNNGTFYGISVSSSKFSGTAISNTTLPYTALDNGSSWAWSSWTPSWTNFTLGNGTVTYATYKQIGKNVFFKIKVVLGSTSSVSGTIAFSTPATMNSNNFNQMILCQGFGSTNGGSYYQLSGVSASTTTIALYAHLVGSTYIDIAATSSTVPVTWATSSSFALQGFYEAA